MYIIVLITVPTKKSAKQISEYLLENKLVACVNIISKVDSFFWWQKKIDKAREMLLIAKTQKKLFTKLVKAVKLKHPYTVPEIIALPIIMGNKQYLRWIGESCG